MGQAITSIKNSTMNFVHSFQRLDSQLPVPYEDLGVIPEVVYDTDQPEDYGEDNIAIDWAYNEQDMLNSLHPEDPTLIINELLADPTFEDLDPVVTEGLNKASAIVMGLGDMIEIDTKGLYIDNLSPTSYIQKSILPLEDYPLMKTGRVVDIPEPEFSYTIAISGTELVPEDLTVSYTWLNIYLSVPGDIIAQSDILYTENDTVVDTSDAALENLASVDYVEADEDIPTTGTQTYIAEGTIILPPNIIIQ